MDIQYTYTWKTNTDGSTNISFYIGTKAVHLKAKDWYTAQCKIAKVKTLLDSHFSA